MQRLLALSRYHFGVIAIYLVLTPFFFLWTGNRLRYNFSDNHPTLQIGIILFTLFAFSFFLLQKPNKFNASPTTIVWTMIYGTLFAFPEEIIFRGIVQGVLLSSLPTAALIVLSSLVFGLAHVLNGAKNYYPSGWNWKLFAMTFLAGLPLGTLYAITNSLLLPTALHVVFVTCLQLFKK